FGVTAINLLVVVICIVMSTLTAEYLIWVTVGLTVLPAVWGFIDFVRRERIFSPRLPLFKNSVKYGFVIYVGAVANLLHFRVDQLMISNLLDLRAVGLYAVSIRFAEMILLLDIPLSTASLKRISSSTKEKSWKLTRKISLIQFTIS